MFSIADRQYMTRAIQLARLGLYSTDPNPRVGCVIVKNEQVVGEGWHAYAGGPHAEVNALHQAGSASQGATAYVTLEPCSHFGKTPPCADALIAAGVQRVVAAMQDPNPQVAGQGFERLRAAGIAVSSGLCESEAAALNPGFIKRQVTGLPLVRIKMAMSMDGRTAMRSGESQWITGPHARQDVQRLRARSSAIVTGVGTVLHDNPSLTVRPDELGLEESRAELASRKQPLRVIVDSGGQSDPGAKIFQAEGDVVVASLSSATVPDGLRSLSNVQVVPFSPQQTAYGSGVDLPQLLHWLGKQGMNEVLVEAGATLSGQFVEQGLFDELWLYVAPTLLGSDARPLFDMPLQAMSEQRRLSLVSHRMVGDDICYIFKPQLQEE